MATQLNAMLLSADQEHAIRQIRNWYSDGSEHFRLGGLAGTGKTTISALLPSLIGASIQYAAPTGRAASVLTRKLGTEARTLHSILYLPESSTIHDDSCVCSEGHKQEEGRCLPVTEGSMLEACTRIGCICPTNTRWVKRSEMEEPPPMASILVIDEASMVGETLYNDVCELPCRKIWVGDYGQLPPVMDGRGVMSEASLDAKLTQIHRQADNPAGTNIVELAHAVRTYGKEAIRNWEGEGVTVKRMSIRDVRLKADPTRLVLCWKNATRVVQNARMRASMGMPEGEPVVGDKVICLRNNREAQVFNGQMGTITVLENKNNFVYTAVIEMEDGNVFKGDIVKAQFGKEKTLNDGYGNLFDWAYAITVHKSQGSEADEVVLLAEGYQDMGAGDPRWSYTGITRAKKKLTVVLP